MINPECGPLALYSPELAILPLLPAHHVCFERGLPHMVCNYYPDQYWPSIPKIPSWPHTTDPRKPLTNSPFYCFSCSLIFYTTFGTRSDAWPNLPNKVVHGYTCFTMKHRLVRFDVILYWDPQSVCAYHIYQTVNSLSNMNNVILGRQVITPVVNRGIDSLCYLITAIMASLCLTP